MIKAIKQLKVVLKKEKVMYLGSNYLFYYADRKENILGAKLGVSMWRNCVEEGLRIWHYGSIIVNANAWIGKDCQLYGNNCIGNKGTTDKGVPIIGDNVDIGI